MRFILLHHHIFKNAGSTLDAALARYFGQDFAEFHLDPSPRIRADDLYFYLESHPHIRALSSHHFFGQEFKKNLSAEQAKKYNFFDCVLIRHPIKRLVSMYQYYRKTPQTDHPLSIAAHDLSVQAFLELLMQCHPNYAINAQVALFGCYGRPPSHKTLKRALFRLGKVSMLGTVEEFTKTMVVSEYFLQPVFRGLQLHYGQRENVSQYDLLSGYDGSVQSIKNMLGEDFFSRLCHMNDLDIQLWMAVTDELNRRASYIYKFHERIEDFEERCNMERCENIKNSSVGEKNEIFG